MTQQGLGHHRHMVDRPLSNDTLGKKGERRFGELCDDANLIANTADHDRAGWDYIVDFRLPTDGKGLDARPAPISARVQVKTQWDDQTAVKLRLTSAEHLVKHNGPSFICVLSVNSDLEFTGLRLIHCRGQVLELVLKRLRRAEADGEKPNQIDLHLNPSHYADQIPAHHEALRAALETVCSTNHLSYLQAKQAELNNLGFDTSFIDLKATFMGSEDDLVDAFLGLRSIDAKDVSATQKRFGISLPFEGIPMTQGTFLFEPHAEKCDLMLNVNGETWSFKAKVIRPPSLIAEQAQRPKFLIRTDLFQITIMQERKPSATLYTFSFRMLESATLEKHKPAAWAGLYAVFSTITEEKVEMSFKPRGEKRIRFTLDLNGSPERQSRWRILAALAHAASRVFGAAGAPNAKVGMQELMDASSEIQTAYGLLASPERLTRLSFITSSEIALPNEQPIDAFLGHAFTVGEHVIACGIRTVIKGEKLENGDTGWTSEPAVFDGIQRVGSSSAFQRFVRNRSPASCTLLSGTYQSGMDIFYRGAAEAN